MQVSGRITRREVAELRRELLKNMPQEGVFSLDLAQAEQIDSAGVALLAVIAKKMAAAGGELRLQNVPETVAETLKLFPFRLPQEEEEEDKVSRLEWLGQGALNIYEVVLHYLSICADVLWFTVQTLRRPGRMRWQVLWYEMSALGSQALGVVGLIAFLVGATMALQSAVQLRQFGANIFVVDLIGISMTRELGPLMAAIMVAGRSGSAVAAEIGTMMINEEIDALETMGINPIRFLVVPKLLAITLTQPLLTVLADVAGIFGGFLVAILYLDVGPSSFFDRLQESMYLKDLLTGLIKSLVFAQLIVTVGALCGFRTKGGADAVGRSTTTSVVAGIFAVIVADAIASLLFYFGE